MTDEDPDRAWFRERVVAWVVFDSAREVRHEYLRGKSIGTFSSEEPNLFHSLDMEPITINVFDGPSTVDGNALQDREAVAVHVIPEHRAIYRYGANGVAFDACWLGYSGLDPEFEPDWQQLALERVAREKRLGRE